MTLENPTVHAPQHTGCEWEGRLKNTNGCGQNAQWVARGLRTSGGETECMQSVYDCALLAVGGHAGTESRKIDVCACSGANTPGRDVALTSPETREMSPKLASTPSQPARPKRLMSRMILPVL